MPEAEFGKLTLLLLLLVGMEHLLGHLFTRLRQPRVIGEILAGVLIGPSLLGRMAAHGHLWSASGPVDVALKVLYNLGLLLLMFLSGAEARRLFGASDRRPAMWIALVGTAVPFLIVMAASPHLPMGAFMGKAQSEAALALIVSIAAAVTSIPVISRIFHDLKILHTRFARVVLGAAVLEDLALWGVLAVATSLAGAAVVSVTQIGAHVLGTVLYFLVGLLIAPPVLRWIHYHRNNFLFAASPLGYVVVVLFAYTSLAAAMQVSMVFAAFLAGFAIACEPELFREAVEALSRTSYALFIPIYFAVVGYRLDLSHGFSWKLLLVFLLGSSALKMASAGLGARLAGFRGLDTVNLAIATNARGGPGIVIASVAYDAGIISSVFYTTLVITAVLTSQAAGAWLDHVLRRGMPLLEPSFAGSSLPGILPQTSASVAVESGE